MADALQRIQTLAKTLGGASLRVLLELAGRAPGAPFSAAASTRELAEATGLSRSNVVAGLGELLNRNLVQKTAGTATKSSGYRLVFLEVAVLPGGGPTAGPPVLNQVDLFQAHPGPNLGPPLDLLQAQGGPIAGPPPNQESTTSSHPSMEHARGARIENYSSSTEQVLDRVLKATEKKVNDEEREWAREWLYGYMRKFGPEREPHPPDTLIIAQLLAIAPRARLEALLTSMFKARLRAGRNYAWFVAVALDRIHGLKFESLGERRSELELVRKPRPAPAEQQPLLAADPVQQVEELKASLRSAAAGKAIRR